MDMPIFKHKYFISHVFKKCYIMACKNNHSSTRTFPLNKIAYHFRTLFIKSIRRLVQKYKIWLFHNCCSNPQALLHP